MAVKQSDWRRIQDIVILAIASTCLVVGVLSGRFTADTIEEASKLDAARSSASAENGGSSGPARGAKTPGSPGSAAAPKQKSPAGKPKQSAVKSNKATKNGGSVAKAEQLVANAANQTAPATPGSTGANQPTGDDKTDSSGAVPTSSSALTLYGIFAIWGTFLVSAVWESSKSLASTTSKKLVAIGLGTGLAAGGLTVAAAAVSVNLFFRTMNGADGPVKPAEGIAQAGLVLLLLNLAQVLLYRNAPKIPNPDGTPDNATTGGANTPWGMMPTMAKLSGIGATIATIPAVTHLPPQVPENPPAHHGGNTPGPDSDLKTIVGLLNRQFKDLHDDLQNDLQTQSKAYNAYGTALGVQNERMLEVSSGIQKAVIFLDKTEDTAKSTAKASQTSLQKFHEAAKNSAKDAIGADVIWLQSERKRIVAQDSILKRLNDAAKKADEDRKVADEGWTSHKIPYSYYESAIDQFDRLVASRDEARAKFRDLFAEARLHITLSDAQWKQIPTLEQRKRKVDWALTRAHNIVDPGDLDQDDTFPEEKEFLANWESEKKFFDNLEDPRYGLESQDDKPANPDWELIDRYITEQTPDTKVAAADSTKQ